MLKIKTAEAVVVQGGSVYGLLGTDEELSRAGVFPLSHLGGVLTMKIHGSIACHSHISMVRILA